MSTEIVGDGSWFRGRVALVTGAGSGMGAAIAQALGRRGACVGVHYRNNERGARKTAEEIEAGGGKTRLLQADLTNSAEVTRLFTELDRAFDEPVGMLVNNAGDWMDKKPILECDEATWERMLRVNVTSVFLCSREAAGRMVRRREGAIVNLGSLAGHTGGGGGTVPYAAAKAAAHTFTRGLARELAPFGVRVNAVAPGMVDTPMLEGRVSESALSALCAATPLGRLGQAEEVAPLVLTLLSPDASFITGQVIDINGGLLMR